MTTRIMVIDDEVLICQLLTYQLSGVGYEVASVQSGQEALRRLIIEQPDLVLLDVMIGDMSGWDVCRHIRANSDVPIIMLTAKGADSDIVTGLTAGADDYMTKPFNLSQLLARIEAVLRRVHLEEAAHAQQRKSYHGVDLHSAQHQISDRANGTVRPMFTPILPVSTPPQQPTSVISMEETVAISRETTPNDNESAIQSHRLSLGQRLEVARKQRGLTLHQAEHVCGVRWDFLQALEREHFEYMPRAQWRHALTTYSALLNIDVNEYIEKHKAPSRWPWSVSVAVVLVAMIVVVLVGLQLF